MEYFFQILIVFMVALMCSIVARGVDAKLMLVGTNVCTVLMWWQGSLPDVVVIIAAILTVALMFIQIRSD